MKKRALGMSRLLFLLMVFHADSMNNYAISSDGNLVNLLNNRKIIRMHSHLTINDSILHMVNSPAFKGFGRYLLPRNNGANYDNTPLNNVGSLLPYHNHVDPNIVVAAVNHMIEEVNDGKTIFYEFYTEREKQVDHTKASTGLFFFRGKPGAPFAIVCPGGGFAYVGSLHEGFPHAVELSKKGYNTFVLKYRVGGELRATEDLVAAISYIIKKAEMFEVGLESYSLWGFSAGARMVGNTASSGTAGFGGVDFPKPRVVVIAYTGQSRFSKNYPPVFMMVSEDDPIVDVSVVDRRVMNLRNAGIDVEYRKYRKAGHGFGLGLGTDAEGWMEHAIQFCEKHLHKAY